MKTADECKTKGTFLVNDKNNPVRFGEITIKNKTWQTDKNSKTKKGILVKNVMTGFCGTDYKLMDMGEKNELSNNFPKDKNRLVNGHEVIAYNPKNKKYGVLLVRGGNARDATRFSENEQIFEYGCSEDGGMCYESYYHPDMLLKVPEKALQNSKLTEKMAKKLIFSDPYACAIFHRERIEEMASAHNFRIFLNEEGSEKKARLRAIKEIYKRIVVFGPGTTGFFMAIELDKACKEHNIPVNIIAIGRSSNTPQAEYFNKYTKVKYVQNTYGDNLKMLSEHVKRMLNGNATLFVGASGDGLESKLAFEHKLLGNNAVYDNLSLGPDIKINSFSFSFNNQLLMGSVNYRKEHMEKAILKLIDMPLDNLVKIYNPSDIEKNPMSFYKNEAYSRKDRTIKSAVIWDKSLLG